jgi:hypothetical protein
MDVGFCMQAFSHSPEELRKPGFLPSTVMLVIGTMEGFLLRQQPFS